MLLQAVLKADTIMHSDVLLLSLNPPSLASLYPSPEPQLMRKMLMQAVLKADTIMHSDVRRSIRYLSNTHPISLKPLTLDQPEALNTRSA